MNISESAKNALKTMTNAIPKVVGAAFVATAAFVVVYPGAEIAIKDMARDGAQAKVMELLIDAQMAAKTEIRNVEGGITFDEQNGINGVVQVIQNNAPENSLRNIVFDQTSQSPSIVAALNNRVDQNEPLMFIDSPEGLNWLDVDKEENQSLLFSVENPQDVAFMAAKIQQLEAVNPNATHAFNEGVSISPNEAVMLRGSEKAFDEVYGNGAFAAQEKRWSALVDLGEQFKNFNPQNEEEQDMLSLFQRDAIRVLMRQVQITDAPLPGEPSESIATRMLAAQAVVLGVEQEYLHRLVNQAEMDLDAKEQRFQEKGIVLEIQNFGTPEVDIVDIATQRDQLGVAEGVAQKDLADLALAVSSDNLMKRGNRMAHVEVSQDQDGPKVPGLGR